MGGALSEYMVPCPLKAPSCLSFRLCGLLSLPRVDPQEEALTALGSHPSSLFRNQSHLQPTRGRRVHMGVTSLHSLPTPPQWRLPFHPENPLQWR